MAWHSRPLVAQESDRLSSAQRVKRANRLEALWIGSQLRKERLAELVPVFLSFPVAREELAAGGQGDDPLVEAIFLHASWIVPRDQHAHSVLWVLKVVDALRLHWQT